MLKLRVGVPYPNNGEILPKAKASLDKLRNAKDNDFDIEIFESSGASIACTRNGVVHHPNYARSIYQSNFDFDFYMCIDSDIEFKVEDVRKLISHDKDIVTGAYAHRGNNQLMVAGHYNEIFGLVTEDKFLPWAATGLVEIDWAGAGFLLIKKDVFTKIEYPWFREEITKYIVDGVVYATWAGEDVGFCMAAKKAGYKIWCDCDVKVNHLVSDPNSLSLDELEHKVSKSMKDTEKYTALMIKALRGVEGSHTKANTISYKDYTFMTVDIQVTDHCNLNCTHCCTFSPFAETKFLDLNVFQHDLNKLKQITNDGIMGLNLAGGEPLQHPELIAIIDIAKKSLNSQGKIFLFTNGILLQSMRDEFFVKCSDPQVQIVLSDYSIDIDINEISKLLAKHNVAYCTSQDYFKAPKGYFFARKLNPDKSSADAECWHCCTLKTCPVLHEGKLYRCPVICNSRHLTNKFGYKFEITESDYLHIEKLNDAADIKVFLDKQPEFCKYCVFPVDMKKHTTNGNTLIENYIELISE